MSDEKEWTILSAGAVRVFSPHESYQVRKESPGRIITSRMIRRWKPAESANEPPIAKSRWCIQGYQDPDSGGALQVFVPTPTTLAIYRFLIIMQTSDMSLAVGDCNNVFASRMNSNARLESSTSHLVRALTWTRRCCLRRSSLFLAWAMFICDGTQPSPASSSRCGLGELS